MNVYRYKYIAVIVSGALAGFGGAYLAVISVDLPRRADRPVAASSVWPR